jgi:hypothetical protein
MSMKNSSDTIGNRTPDLLACSAVPQPSAPLHTPEQLLRLTYFKVNVFMRVLNLNGTRGQTEIFGSSGVETTSCRAHSSVNMIYDIFNCKWVDTRWHTFIHKTINTTTQSTQTIHRTTQFRKNADRVPSLRGIPWHLPYR